MDSAVTDSVPYRILIVEDDPTQQKDCRDFLQQEANAKDIAIEIDIANSSLEAKALLDKKYFHFASIDQRVPFSEEEQILDENGIAFSDYLVRKSPLTQRALYTAYGTIPNANIAGIMNGTHYWQKSTQTDRDKKQFEADGWAKEILRILNEKHIDFCMLQAAKNLPLSFARLAAEAALNKPASDAAATLNALKRLAEDVIQLAWLVSMATEQQGQASTAPVRPVLKEKAMIDLLDKQQVGELSNYLGHDSQAFETYLLPLVHDLRAIDHPTLANTDLAAFQQKYRNGLLILTDMLAWLAGHWLVMRKPEAGLWKKLAPIQGASTIQHTEIGLNEREGESGCLYWAAPVIDQENPALQKLDPLVHYLYNPRKDAGDLALFSHREGSSWVYRTLAQDELIPANFIDPGLPQQLERIFATGK